MEEHEKNTAKLEAVLFLHGEPISIKRIASLLEESEGEVRQSVDALKHKLQEEDRALTIIEEGDKIQLATKSAFAHIAEGFLKEELSGDLSPAAVETLAIICYFGPISKTRIEYLRGVNSGMILRNLAIRGLVEKEQDPDRPSGTLYSASFELLRRFGIEKRSDLPDFEKYKEMLQRMEEGKDIPEENTHPEVPASQ